MLTRAERFSSFDLGKTVLGLGPQVQGVAGAVALEAVEALGMSADAEAVGRASVRAVEGTGAALLAAVIGTGHEAKQAQHLSDGDGGTHGGEVDGRMRLGPALLLFVPGLPHLFAALAGLGQLAVALAMDGLVVAEQPVVGRDVAHGTVQA